MHKIISAICSPKAQPDALTAVKLKTFSSENTENPLFECAIGLGLSVLIDYCHQLIHENAHLATLLLFTDADPNRILVVISINPLSDTGGSVLYSRIQDSPPQQLPGIDGTDLDPTRFRLDYVKTVCAESCETGLLSHCVPGGLRDSINALGQAVVESIYRQGQTIAKTCEGDPDFKPAIWHPTASTDPSLWVKLNDWGEIADKYIPLGIELGPDDSQQFGLFDAVGVLAQIPLNLISLQLKSRLRHQVLSPAHLETHFISPQTRQELLKATLAKVKESAASGIIGMLWKSAELLMVLNSLLYIGSGLSDFQGATRQERGAIASLLLFSYFLLQQRLEKQLTAVEATKDAQLTTVKKIIPSEGNTQEAWELLTILGHQVQTTPENSLESALRVPKYKPFFNRLLSILGYSEEATARLTSHKNLTPQDHEILNTLRELLVKMPIINKSAPDQTFPEQDLADLVRLASSKKRPLVNSGARRSSNS